MAHESFEDPETAALMNERFVNIKVDREERPDIDHLYMSALHALGEQGGWPLTMFLAPDGAPFWGGTYFPPEPRWGRPSFRQVLQGVAEAYRADDEMVAHNTAALRQALAAHVRRQRPGDLPTPVHLDAVAAALLRHDRSRAWRPAGRAEIPQSADLPLPLAERVPHRRGRGPGGAAPDAASACRRAASTTISAAAIRAIRPTRSGWCRISRRCCTTTRSCWSCWRWRTRIGRTRCTPQRAAETVGWMVRDMTAASVNGRAAFAASEDADSEGEEGRFYVWTEAEIDALLGRRRRLRSSAPTT